MRHGLRAARRVGSWAAVALILTAATPAGAPFTPKVQSAAREIRDRALSDDTAYETLRSLTTEVGPRSAGSEGDRRAVAWALARLRTLGFQNVHSEPVKVRHWVRGEARAEIVTPWPQRLVAVALGGSVATPASGIEAEVVPVTNLTELKGMKADQVSGRIVFFTRRMLRTHDGSGYSTAVAERSRGAAEAAKLGARAVVIRSAGTSTSRIAHTGGMRYEKDGVKVPALALSNTDADMVEHQLALGVVRLRLFNTSQMADSEMSANVIGEFPGRGARDQIVLLGAHLDSWDLGTGANDDGAGVAIVTSAARLAGREGTRRTLRVVLYADEEFGGEGSDNYVKVHGGEIAHTVACTESDLGAFPIWGMASRVPMDRIVSARALHAVIEPMGIPYIGNQADGGSDVDTLGHLGVPVFDFKTDASPYFDLHHTIDDTFDHVDPKSLRENVAAYAMLAYLVAATDVDFGRIIWTR